MCGGGMNELTRIGASLTLPGLSGSYLGCPSGTCEGEELLRFLVPRPTPDQSDRQLCGWCLGTRAPW